MELKPLIVLVTIFLSGLTDASRILCLFPTPSRSNVVIASELLKGLAQRGHEVTMLSPFPLEKRVKNYRDVVSPNYEEHTKLVKSATEDAEGFMAPFMVGLKLTEMSLAGANKSLHTPEFQKIMKEESFDLVINSHFIADFMLGVAAHFKCPSVVLSTVEANRFTNDLVGNPTSASTVRHILLNGSGPMKFKDRLRNMCIIMVEYFFNLYRNYRHEQYYKANFPVPKYPAFKILKQNVSLVLASHHYSLGNPRPNVPNMVDVGGLHIKPKPDPLPEDMQKWFDEAADGVIYFSLGTNFKSIDLPEVKRDAILKTFGKLKQRVLWKWENDTMPGKPKNVMIRKWTSQTNVLGHPNVKLFVTHCGLGSMHEAKFRAVPVVGLPLFGDQFINVDVAVAEGWAVRVTYENMTQVSFKAAIDEALTNPKYKSRVTYLSELFNDRITPPLDTAIYWIEYIIRHHGAKHLQNGGVLINFFSYHSIDVMLLLAGLTFIIGLITWSLIKYFWQQVQEKCCKKCTKEKKN